MTQTFRRFLAVIMLIGFTSSCRPEGPMPRRDEPEPPRQNREELNFEGRNLSDFLFTYYADHYTDTYTVSDGQVQIVAEYEFFSSWGCITYYLAVEKAIRINVANLTAEQVITGKAQVAKQTETWFTERYSKLAIKIRNLKFKEVMRQTENSSE